MKPTYRKLLEEAEAEIDILSPEQAIALVGSESDLLVDVRDSGELQREGTIPGSVRAERGMLEFTLDPESPFHDPSLTAGKRLVFYCAGGWRSALSAQTAKRLGIARVGHVRGGLDAWKAAGGPVSATWVDHAQGDRVTGIGGIFFKASDKAKLDEWYLKHLGIAASSGGGAAFTWKEIEGGRVGMTVWSIHRHDSTYYNPSRSTFMINYRVRNLRALLAQLRSEGVDVDDKVDEYDYGRFGWCQDPEGNRLELWEPLP